jgi:small-conductance mechanosensitive channel
MSDIVVELRRLALELWAELLAVNRLWELGALLACALAGWLITLRLNRRLAGSATPGSALALGIGGMRRLMFPLSVLALLLAGSLVLRLWQKTPLLDIAATLLLAMALIRVAIYALRQTFAPGGWLRASERWLSWLAWAAVAVHLTGLWPPLREILDGLAFSTGRHRLSLLMLLQGLLWMGATVLTALWLGRLLERRLMAAASLQINVRVIFAKLAQMLLLLVAVLISLPAVGIDLTVLSVFGGMLGVGIGFGLQKIAANYISGFIILLDRSVSIGDVVSIGEHSGVLTRMTARHVVLRAVGGTEAIIPNETLITSTVINQTLSDRKVRVALPLQVAGGADLALARRLIAAAGAAHPRVLRDPAPAVLITGLGEGSINLELGVWIEDPEQGLAGLRSELYEAILGTCREAGIELPLPPREWRLVAATAVPVRNDQK